MKYCKYLNIYCLSIFYECYPNEWNIFLSFVAPKITKRDTNFRKLIPPCKTLYEVLCGTYLSVLKTKKQWKQIINDIEELWQFPHVIEAIDGKHVCIQAPNKSRTFSITIKDFLVCNYLQFVTQITTLHSLMLSNMGLILIVLFL